MALQGCGDDNRTLCIGYTVELSRLSSRVCTQYKFQQSHHSDLAYKQFKRSLFCHRALGSAHPGTPQQPPLVDTLRAVRGGARRWQGWGEAHSLALGVCAHEGAPGQAVRRLGGAALLILVLDKPRRMRYGKTSHASILYISRLSSDPLCQL